MKNITFILFSLASLSSCDSWLENSHDIYWTSNDVELAGTLILPESNCKGLVILIHGSGNVDRTSKSYATHAYKLVEFGMAVFYYDKRGVGQSEGNWKEANFEILANDVTVVIPELLKFPELENVKIGFMGFSQGAWVSLIASEQFRETDFLMSISGSVNTPEEQGRYINEKILESKGYSNEIKMTADSLDRIISKVYLTNSGWENASEILNTYNNNQWYKDIGLGLQEKNSWNWKWYSELPMNFDPKLLLMRWNKPYFAAHGGKDPIVDAKSAFHYLENFKSQGWNITNFMDPDAGHLLERNKNKWDDLYWETIKSWLIKEQLILIE